MSTENQYRVTISSILFLKCTVIATDGTFLASIGTDIVVIFKVPSAQLCFLISTSIRAATRFFNAVTNFPH